MIYIAPVHIMRSHLQMLSESINAAAEFDRPALADFAAKISNGQALLFEVPTGVVLVEVLGSEEEKRLNILAFYCENFGAHIRGITRNLQRLARDWDCSKIQTVTYSPRLAEMIMNLGGVLESCTLTLESMEASDGQQDEDEAELDPDERTAELDSTWTGERRRASN